MAADDGHWWDAAAGPVVRPYAVTGGRVPKVVFDLVTTVHAAAPSGALPADLAPEHRLLLAAARQPVTVADLAADLDLAVVVVQVLLNDLAGQELIRMYEPDRAGPDGGARRPGVPDVSVLKAVVNGLRAL